MHYMQRSTGVVIVLIVMCLFPRLGHAQSPSPSPAPSNNGQTPEKPKGEAENAAKPAPEPEDLWHQESMTGDWGGTRSRWKEKGIELEFRYIGVYQDLASGGLDDRSSLTNKLETTWKFDLGKVAGWKFWSSQIKAEWRFGGPALAGTGGVNFSNVSGIGPADEGNVVSVTALNFTRIIPKDMAKGNLWVVSFGRFNILDLVDEDFFGGGGESRFFNIALSGPLTALRQVPLVTNGVSFATVKGGVPRFTLLIVDPNDQSLDPGLDPPFEDGVSFAPAYNIPAKYFGKTAKHTFSGAITTKKYTPFDAIRQIIIPGPALNPIEPKRGSWSVNYVFRQYLVERGNRDGWGFFTQLSVADKDTSPVTRFFNFGLGGNGLVKSRNNDEFGVTYAYTGLSKTLKDNINLITFGNRTLQAEHLFEGFYNLHITPWLRLTGDLQIIRGVRPRVDTSVIPGARLDLVF